MMMIVVCRSNFPPCLQDLSEYLRTKKSSEEEARTKFGEAAKSTTARWDYDNKSHFGKIEPSLKSHTARAASAQTQRSINSRQRSPRNRPSSALSSSPKERPSSALSSTHRSGRIDRRNSAVSFKSGRHGSRPTSATSRRSRNASPDRTYTPQTVPPIYSYSQFPHIEGGARREKEFSARSHSLRSRLNSATLEKTRESAYSSGFTDLAYAAEGGRHGRYVKAGFPAGAVDLSRAAGLNSDRTSARPLTTRWWNQRKSQTGIRAKESRHIPDTKEEDNKTTYLQRNWNLSRLALDEAQISCGDDNVLEEHDYVLLEDVTVNSREEIAKALDGFENAARLSLSTKGYSPDALSRVLAGLPKLRNIRLERCRRIFDECRSGSKDLSMAVLPSIATAPKRVHSLSLAYCDTVEDFHILGIAGATTYNSTYSVKHDADRVDIEQLAKAAAGATYRGMAMDVIACPGAKNIDEGLMSREEYRQKIAKKAEEKSRKAKQLEEKQAMESLAKSLGMNKPQDKNKKEEEGEFDEDELIDSRLYAPLDPSSGKWPCLEEEGIPDTVALCLETLDLTSCKGITDRSLFFLGNACHELTHISLRLCTQAGFTDRGVWGLCRGTPRLLSIDLTGCSQITSVGVRAVVYSCPLLQELILSGCRQIDEYTPYAIACAPCRASLRYVDLTRAEAVTAISVLQMIQSCKAIEKVNITLCTTISQGEAYSLGYAVPWVTIIRSPDEYYTQEKAPRLVPGFKPLPKSETFDYNARVNLVTTTKPKKNTKAKK